MIVDPFTMLSQNLHHVHVMVRCSCHSSTLAITVFQLMHSHILQVMSPTPLMQMLAPLLPSRIELGVAAVVMKFGKIMYCFTARNTQRVCMYAESHMSDVYIHVMYTHFTSTQRHQARLVVYASRLTKYMFVYGMLCR